jgi:ribosomal protein S12 methylthiotransferase accessory factor YcaO
MLTLAKEPVMSKPNALKEALQNDLDALAQTRDELLLQMSLAKAEARDDWKALEQRWGRVQSEIKRTASDSEETVKELGETVRHLLDDLKGGYARIKRQLKDNAGTSE